jgi:hypothetical protein
VRRRTRDWLPFCDHLLLNEVEITSLAETATVEAAMEKLADLMAPAATIVVKLGPAGAIARRGRPAGAAEIARVAAPDIVPVDTIGAGDVFNAGYLAAVARGEDLVACLAAGVRIASRAVSTLPRRYDIDA